jgi:hypothetical protein
MIYLYPKFTDETEEVGPELVFPPKIVIELGPVGNKKALSIPLFNEKLTISHLFYCSFNLSIFSDRSNVPV